MKEALIDKLDYVDVYTTLPKYLGKHAEQEEYKPRMPGYLLPQRTSGHWFMHRKGDWFGAATGSLFNLLTVREKFPVTRLLLLMRRSGRDA
jgi:hypothetical protein